MGDFLMPSLGADMDSGRIVEWRVGPGDTVHRGDIVAVVDTDKADIEVEVFEDGVIEALLVEAGREVSVGAPLARIAAVSGAEAQATPVGAVAPPPTKPAKPTKRATKPPPKQAAKQAAKPSPKRAAGHDVASQPATTRLRASPLARREAAEQGIDLAAVAGTGPGGAVVVADLTGPTVGTPPTGRAAPAVAAAPEPAGRDQGGRQASMRRAIGDLMARSKREIPHYYVATTVDLAAATAWLAAENDRRPVGERLLPAALLLKATALAARQVPTLNGFWGAGGFEPSAAVHLGVAVALRGGGLVAPAIHDAEQLAVGELMAALRDLVERARAGRLRASEMADPTITVTSLGEQGADEVLGVIYPPQVAMVGFGRVKDRPWASDGMLGVHPTVRATLAADHRATDGHEGSRFLAAVDRLLQTPEEL